MIRWVPVILFAIALPLAVRFSGLHRNSSPSVPMGLYRETAELGGAYAAICLPEGIIEIAKSEGLQIERGDCPGGTAPILKPLFQATESSPILFSADGFRVSGRLLRNTAPKRRSRTGAIMAHYVFGEYRKGLWAISDYSPDSFDSRYFGPIDRGAIRFYAKPVWTK